MTNRVEVELTARDSTGPAFDSATRRAGGFKRELLELNTPVGQLARAAGQARAALAGLGVLALADQARAWHVEIQKTVGDLAAQADAVGLNTDQLQAYQAAARSAGLSVEAMQAVIAQGNVTIGMAARGEQGAAEAYQQLGVRILDVNGKVRDNTEIMTEATRALLSIEDGTTRAALAKQIFGRAGSQLTPVLRELAAGMYALDRAAQQAGQTVDRETIEIFRKLNDQQDETLIRLRTLYAQAAAPLQMTAVETLNGLVRNLSENLRGANLGLGDLLMLAANPALAPARIAAMFGPTQRERQQSEIDQLYKNIATDQSTLDRFGPNDARRGVAEAAIAKRRAEVAAKERQLQLDLGADAASRFVGDFTNTDPAASRRPGARFAQPKAGGAEARDRIGEEIAKLAAETRAAEDGLRVLSAARPGDILANLERAAELEKKIGEIVAAAGKYKPSDDRIAQLRVEASAAEGARQAYERKKQILELADATEARYGDGQRKLRDDQQRLTEAVATGRLTQEAMNAAMLEGSRVAEDQALKLQGLQGGMTGFVAGLQYAIAQEERQNSVFNLGVQAWQQGSNAFRSLLSDLESGAEITFPKVASLFGKMIADMTFAWATSQLSKGLFGSGGAGGDGGLLGGLMGLLGLGGSSAGGASATVSAPAFGAGSGDFYSGLSLGGSFAEGGRPPVGVPSIVGERGPELFVPDAGGTVLNRRQLAGLGGGVTIAPTFFFGSDVDHATLRSWGEQITRSIPDIVAGEISRGGELQRAMG